MTEPEVLTNSINSFVSAKLPGGYSNPVDIPNAPSSIDSLRIDFMLSISFLDIKLTFSNNNNNLIDFIIKSWIQLYFV